MAKGIDKGQAPKDHPMFSGGPQLFSPQRFKPSSTPTPASTDEAELPPDEPYEDTFEGRGQELQDEHDALNNLLDDNQSKPDSASIDPAELPLALTLARTTARPVDSASSPGQAAAPASKGLSKTARATTPPVIPE